MNISKSDFFTTLDVENEQEEIDSDDEHKNFLQNSNYISIDVTVPCPTEGRFFEKFYNFETKKITSNDDIAGNGRP